MAIEMAWTWKLSGSEFIQTAILIGVTFLVSFYIITETSIDSKTGKSTTKLSYRIGVSLFVAILFSLTTAYLSKFVDDQYTKRGKLKH